MFHLTPQERAVVIAFAVICMVGSLIRLCLNADARPMRWVNTASQKIYHPPPNINTDDAKALDRIDGIGLKTAERIVAYRKEHGSFASLDDLAAVKGVTKKTIAKIKAFYEEAKPKDE